MMKYNRSSWLTLVTLISVVGIAESFGMNPIGNMVRRTSSYMKKRQKNLLTVAGLEVLFTAYISPRFDKDAFIAGEEDGETIYNKYLKNIPMERVTVRLAKAQQ